MTAVHQFVPTFEPGAVGGHIVEIRRLCHDLGLESEVYAEHVRAGLPGHPFRSYRGTASDVLLYHVAIGSDVADFVAAQSGHVVVDHHNITPAHFYAPWEPAVVHGISWGRQQLAELTARAELGIADSAFNEGELQELGYRRTGVVPIVLDLASFQRAADDATLDRLRARTDGTAWLFVGRVAPNKAHHDVIKAFAVYRRVYDDDAVLRLVGGSSSDTYLEALHELAEALDIEDAVEVTGPVSDAELAAHYRAADVFVCLSDHEGFCVPLLEAMHHRLPIVAFASTAVPDTLGDAGLCLPSKAPTTVAAAVWRIRSDAALTRQLVEAGERRLADFALPATRARMQAVLEDVL